MRKVNVLDICLGGARLEPVPGLGAGEAATLIFNDLSIAGKVTWIAEDSLGIRFEPAKLEPEELQRIVSETVRAA
jgi:hypothetical protein